MTPNIPNRVIAGFLSLSLGLFSVPVMPAALADGLIPVAVKDPQQEKSVTSDYSQKTTESQNANRPEDIHTLSFDDNPLSTNSAPAPATRPFSAKAAVSPDGKDILSVAVKEGGKAVVTLTQYGQKQSYEGKYDEASQSIRIDNVKYGYSWNVSFETTGAQVSLKRFDIIMNQAGYNYEQRYGFSGQRLSYREYASSSTTYGSYDSLYRQSYVTDAAGRTLEHTLSVNKSTYTPSMYGTADGSSNSSTGGGGAPGMPVTQYSIWTNISSLDAKGRPVSESMSLYGGVEEIQGIEDLYLKVRETLESGNINYDAVGQAMQDHPAVFMKTASTYSGFPAAWNNLLYSVEYVRGPDGNFEARIVRNKNDYQNVDIVVSSEGGITPDQWKKLRFKNWQSVAVEGRSYTVSYGMTYENRNGMTAAGSYNSDGRLGKPVYGLSFISWFQDPVSKTWLQDQVIVENFPENRRAVIGGKEYDIELNSQGIVTLKAVPQTNPGLEALRLKIAAMIEAVSADIARFEEAADSKIHQVEEMVRVMNPLAGEVSEIFNVISGFENIPGMEALKGEAQKIHASARQGITGVEGIVSYLKGDAGLDQLDIESLQGFIAKLQKIAESLVPGTDPAGVKLPDSPQLSERPQFRPSVNFEEVIVALKGAIVSLNGLLEKAQALRAAHKTEVERAVAFAKSLFLNADGNLNLDLNGDGLMNHDDLIFAEVVYAQGLKYLNYLPADIAAMLDLNGDGKANNDDRDYLLKKITNALKLPALREKIAAMISAAMDEIQAFEKSASVKAGQVDEMVSVMSSLMENENALFLRIEAFENIPGLEEIKAEALDIHAAAAGAAAGTEFIFNWMKQDAGLDLKDAALLKAYVESLKKIAAGLVNGSDPSNVVLPERPELSTREQIRPSISFETAVEIVKDAIASLNGLLETAEALRAAHKAEVERAVAFAKSLHLNTSGSINLDLNGDGFVNEIDRVKAGEGYAQALMYIDYLSQQVIALLDLNGDGQVSIQDRDYLLKKIASASELPALRAKIAAMIETATADIARFEEAAASKIHQAEEIAGAVKPLADEVSEIFNVISSFENIPGVEVLKGEAQKIYASARQGITGVEGIVSYLKGDAGFDQLDIASLRGFIAKLQKIAESLVPGTDPNAIQLPVYPALAVRDQQRPSVDFKVVMEELKTAGVSLRGLLEKAEALRSAHRAEVEKAVAFAKSLYLNADGNINLDLNGDGVVNDADRLRAGAGYAQALMYIDYLSQQVIALLDLNGDGQVSIQDRDYLLKKISDALQLPALRAKIAAMIETATADIARFEEAAASKIHQAEEMVRVMNPLAGEVSDIFNVISSFENIPGMEALKGEAQKIHASARQGITGVEGIVSYLKGDAGLDQLDIESLQGFIAKLQKIAESLVPGTDPSSIVLPAYPELSERPQFRPSVNFEEVIVALKGAIVSLKGLVEKAEALRTAHRAEVEKAVAFAKSLYLNAGGNLNLDLNGDGFINEIDRVKAGEGYAQALKTIDYLSQQVIALLDLNGDGRVTDNDRVLLQKKIENAMDKEGPVIANVTFTPVTRETKAIVKYTVDGVAMEQTFELRTEGENHFVLRAEDEAGNITEFPVLIVRDTIAPELKIVSEVPEVTNAGELSVTYTADGEKHEKIFQLTAGKNELRLEAKDKAGNMSELVFSVLMDNTAPVIRVSSVIPALTNQNDLVVEYFVESGNGEGGQAQRAEFNLSEGVNALKIEAVDAAGNVGVYEFKITLDTIAPVISGVEHVSLTNQMTAIVKYFVDGILTQLEFNLSTEGENILALKAEDAAGNETAREIRIVRDTVAPNIEIISEIPEMTSRSTLKVLYKVDGGSEMEKTFYLVEGVNEIVVKHTDEAGNAGLSEIRQITYKPEAPQNQRPAANGASFKVNQNGELSGFVTGSDEDGDELSYSVAVQPEHGTLEINSNTGAFVYKPDAGFNGADSFSFRVNDGKEYSDDARVALEVMPAGSAPVFEAIADVSLLPKDNLSAKVSLTLSAVDPEGGAVTFSIKEIMKDGKKVNMPERMLLTADGKFDWPPEPAHAGVYVITFEALDLEGFTAQRQMSLNVQTPAICTGNSEVCNFLKDPKNEASGNLGDYYHNRDGFHTNQNLSLWPQLSRMNSGWGAEYATYPDRVIIGNSSTSGGQPGGSNPGALESTYGALATYKQSLANALYFYPEHIDHDLADYYTSNNYYVKVSQGSSGSENDEVRKYFYTLAAFRPEVKEKLKEQGLLISTLEMIFRLTRVGSDEDKYLTGEAHPRAFDNSDNLMAMVRMANAMTLEDIPAFAQIKVVEDDYETGGNYDNKTEKHYDTPAAVSRVHRSLEYTKTMIVDAGQSFDVNGNPLQFEWRVLRGDEDHVRISKVGEGTLWKIEIDYQNEAAAPGSSLGSTILSNRVDIGLFIFNGHTWSAPAFISSSTLRNEVRDYDENGVLKEIRYNANPMASQLGFAKGWVKDVFNANGGWTRTMADGKTIDFTAEGHQVISKDGLGRVLTAKEVTYAYNSGTRKIGFTAGGNLAYYEYANDDDLQGRLSKLEVTTSLGAVYVGRMIYGSEGPLAGVSVESQGGEILSQLVMGANGAVSLTSVDGSMTLKLGGNRTLGQLIDLAGSSAAVIHIMFKAAELLAAEAGVSTADFELRNASVSASPQSAPYDGYMGNLTMLFHNLRQARDSWAYSWTQRPYPLDLYPDYPSQQGFHIAVAGVNQAYSYHDFSMAGAFMGKHAADYEIKKKIQNLAAFQFEKDSGLDSESYTFSVSSVSGDGEEGNFSIGYRIDVRAKGGSVVSTYKVNTRTYSIGNSLGGGGTAGDEGKNGTMYVIQDTSKALDLFGYILVNGAYILAWESHDGVETCHMTDVCSGLR